MSLTFYSFYLGYPGGHSAGKELSSWLSARSVFIYAVFIVCVPFPFGVWKRMWNWIVSLPDYCLFVYFTTIFRPHLTV